MMLRSKSKNVVNVPGQKRKQEGASIQNPTEPAAKKSIGDLSSGIRQFSIDSVKRKAREEKENELPDLFEDFMPRDRNADPCPDYDYDRDQAGIPENVSDYAVDIFKYYKHREANFRVHSYMPQHIDIDNKTRAILVDWLVELQESFELNHESLYNAVKLIDIYLSKTFGCKKEQVQLVASAALFIASKFDERSPPLADDLIYLAGDRFSRDDLMAMERKLFAEVDFDLGAPLSYRYLRRLSRVSQTEMDLLTMARYILETSLLIQQYSQVAASRMACAAFLLANKMRNNDYKWGAVQQKYSGYLEEDIVPLMEHLNHSMHFVATRWRQLSNIRTKYSHEVFYESALQPLLPDTYPETREIPDLPTMEFP